MKKRYCFLFNFILILAVSCECKKELVGPDELPGTYLMNCSKYRDTLIILKDFTFYHSSFSNDNIEQLKTYGKWQETVDGYYELSNYSNAKIVNSWDMKPYRCTKDDQIIIPKSYDGKCSYYKITSNKSD